MHKSHYGLVHNILRRPDVLSLCKLVKVFFGDRAYPLAAVELLAACKLGDYLVKLYFQLCVMVICHIVGSSGEPVTKEMTSQLAGGSFPAPVEICLCRVIHYLQSGDNYSCLKVEVLEQALRIQSYKISTVKGHSLTEYAGENGNIFFICGL